MLCFQQDGRICASCRNFLPWTEFQKGNGPNGKKSHCKACRSYYAKSAYNPLKKFSQHLQYAYGISYEDYEALLTSQKHCCAICLKPLKRGRLRNLDHCHNTGKVRGILCHRCNLALSFFDNDPEFVYKILDYLEKVEKSEDDLREC